MQKIKTYTTKEEKEYIVEEIKKAILNYGSSISSDWGAYIREDPHRTYRSKSRCRQPGGLNYMVIKFTKLEFEDQEDDKKLFSERVEKAIMNHKSPITVSSGKSEILGGFDYIAILFTEPQWAAL